MSRMLKCLITFVKLALMAAVPGTKDQGPMVSLPSSRLEKLVLKMGL